MLITGMAGTVNWLSTSEWDSPYMNGLGLLRTGWSVGLAVFIPLSMLFCCRGEPATINKLFLVNDIETVGRNDRSGAWDYRASRRFTPPRLRSGYDPISQPRRCMHTLPTAVSPCSPASAASPPA